MNFSAFPGDLNKLNEATEVLIFGQAGLAVNDVHRQGVDKAVTENPGREAVQAVTEGFAHGVVKAVTEIPERNAVIEDSWETAVNADGKAGQAITKGSGGKAIDVAAEYSSGKAAEAVSKDSSGKAAQAVYTDLEQLLDMMTECSR